jgi:hypothetical protein
MSVQRFARGIKINGRDIRVTRVVILNHSEESRPRFFAYGSE